MPRIGCHLSLGNKANEVYREAAQHGVECAQIFASSPGAWKPPVPHGERGRASREARMDAGIAPLFIHAIYLINLATDDDALACRAVESLVATLEAGRLLGAEGVITHIGSHGGRGFEAVADTVARRILTVLDSSAGGIDLILENSAGAGHLIGASLGELSNLVERCEHHPRVKITLDTAHLCGAGWDLAAPGAAATLATGIEGSFGADRLAAIHANDSKASPGSHRDRHEAVGDGYIGLAGFAQLLAVPLFRAVPWICETPDLGREEGPDSRYASVQRLRSLAGRTGSRGPEARTVLLDGPLPSSRYS